MLLQCRWDNLCPPLLFANVMFLLFGTKHQQTQTVISCRHPLKSEGRYSVKSFVRVILITGEQFSVYFLRGVPFYWNTTFTRHTFFLPHLLPFILLSMYDHYKKITDKDDRMRKVCLSIKLLQVQIAVFQHGCQK